MSSRRSRRGGTPIVTVLIRKYRSWRSCPSFTACLGAAVRRRDAAGSPPGMDLAPPSRRTTRSSSTRSSLACRSTGISVISSSRSEPLCASSSRPTFSVVAPVNEPLVWPNSSDSMRSLGSAAQLILIHGPSRRALRSCSALAISSLPVPLSPTMRTLASVSATEAMVSITRWMPGARAEDLAVGGLLDQPTAQLGVLGDELPVLERVLHEAQHLVGIERLLERRRRPRRPSSPPWPCAPSRRR